VLVVRPAHCTGCRRPKIYRKAVYPKVNRNARESILDRIVAAKHAEIEALRPRREALERRALAQPVPPDFRAALTDGPTVALIAEVKRRSPSAGAIRGGADAAAIARGYEAAGAQAISVLTDAGHFGGVLADLEGVARAVEVPLLRKDFTIDVVQIYEARAAGAAAILLIARILPDAALSDMRVLAQELGMAALVEVHDHGELDRALATGAEIIGVNNRDLATFTTDLDVTVRIAPHVPAGVVLVAESGIATAADVEHLAGAGVSAVLVGEALMRAADATALTRALASVPRQRTR
jgi:indole-3-glycerol phosphate synthase